MGEGTGGGSWGVENKWRRFRERVLEVGEEVYGIRRIREGRRKKGVNDGVRKLESS